MNNDMLLLRKATLLDVDLLFGWVNDGKVRQNAFDSHTISYKEHKAWFDRMINDPNQAQYILILNNKPVGQVRITVKGTEAEIDYSISESVRGHGYGGEIICLIKEKTKEEYPFVKKLIGRVKPSNIASCKCFMKNDFEELYRQFEYVYK